jgi:DNA-directed RNA polymerase II subunit RPB1
MAIPNSIDIQCVPEPKSADPVFDKSILIENGELLFGIVDEDTAGAQQGSLVHVTFREKRVQKQEHCLRVFRL